MHLGEWGCEGEVKVDMRGGSTEDKGGEIEGSGKEVEKRVTVEE